MVQGLANGGHLCSLCVLATVESVGMLTRVQISLQHFKFISSGHVCSSVIAESVIFLILEGNFILLSVMALINTPNLLVQQEFLLSRYHRHSVFCTTYCTTRIPFIIFSQTCCLLSFGP